MVQIALGPVQIPVLLQSAVEICNVLIDLVGMVGGRSLKKSMMAGSAVTQREARQGRDPYRSLLPLSVSTIWLIGKGG